MQDTHDAGAAAAPSELVIDLKGVSFAYDGPPVLEDVTFQVRARDFLSIVAPNRRRPDRRSYCCADAGIDLALRERLRALSVKPQQAAPHPFSSPCSVV